MIRIRICHKGREEPAGGREVLHGGRDVLQLAAAADQTRADRQGHQGRGEKATGRCNLI